MRGGDGTRRVGVENADRKWDIATKALKDFAGEPVVVSSVDDIKKMYSEEEFFPYGIEKFLDLVNDKNFWEEETVNRAVNEGGIDGEPVVEGYCDIANDGKELEQGTEFYISIATEERGEYWMRKDLILPFLFEDNNGKTIDGKADNASESIKAYKNKWIIDGENANPTYKHSTELKQPDGERRKLIECIVNNELYTPGEPQASKSSEGGARRRRKTYKKRKSRKSRKSRRKRKSKKTKRRRRRRRRK